MHCLPPFSVLVRFMRIGLVLLVCLSLGMHWALLQGVAWTQMLIRYSGEGTLAEAVEKTFDGQHPCPLCHAVEAGREAEQKQPQQSPQNSKKLNAVVVAVTKLIVPAPGEFAFTRLHQCATTRTQAPKTPPPRRGVA